MGIEEIVTTLENVNSESKVDTGILELTDVCIQRAETGRVGLRHAHKHVGSAAVVPCELDVEAVKQTGVEADGKEGLLLPGEILVARL